jgi:hypothetical protein
MTAAPLYAIYCLANPGGEGKTTLTLVFEAIFDLLGRQVALVDVDEGNGSLSISRKAAQGLGWSIGPTLAPRIYADLKDKNIAVDFGANVFASGANVVQLFYALDGLLKQGGHVTTAFVPFSTNKPGSAGSAQAVANNLHLHKQNVCFVRVNRSGSGVYDDEVSQFPVVELGYLDTGYMALVHRLSKERSIASLIREPEPDFELATTYIADWLRRFATQPEIVAAVGGDIEPILDALGYKAKPPSNRFVHLKEVEVRNDRLRHWIAQTAAEVPPSNR